MAVRQRTPQPKQTTKRKLAAARVLARSGNHHSLVSVAEAVGLHPSTLQRYGVTIVNAATRFGTTRSEPSLDQPPELTLTRLSVNPSPMRLQPTPPAEQRRLANVRIGGSGDLNRRALRQLANERLTVETERVAAYPRGAYMRGLSYGQRDIVDCATAVDVLSHSKRPYTAADIEKLANEFRTAKQGNKAQPVSIDAVFVLVKRQERLS